MKVAVSIGLLGLVACSHSESRPPVQEPVHTTSAAIVVAPPAPPAKVATASALVQITHARCDREAACHASGDRNACMNEMGHDVAGEIPSDDCPSIAPSRLQTCLDAIHARICGADGLDTPPACSREQLCASE